MIALWKQRIVIVTPPKTASTSLHFSLCSAEHGGTMIVGPSMYEGNVDKHSTIIPNECQGFRVLLTVRHPLDRLVSLYCHYARHESECYGRQSMAFTEFARCVCRNRSVTGHAVDALYCWSVSHHVKSLAFDGLLKCESLVEDLTSHNVPVASLPHENTSFRRPWRDYFDTELLALAKEWASDDLTQFHYDV